MKPQIDGQLLSNNTSGKVYRNLSVAQLVEKALARGEGTMASNGALSLLTGKYTGRSPDDKFTVDTPGLNGDIDWGTVNRPMSQEKFELLYQRLLAYLQNRDVFIFDGYAGADQEYRLPVRFINEFAWQNLFVHQLFIRPTKDELNSYQPEFTLIGAPGFKADPEVDGTNSEAFVVVNYDEKVVIIGGTHYAGEMKKSIFGVMNYLLPKRDVFPMHCSANVGKNGDAALFFGLSGTGKTTLSADPDRYLIGDDEHGWSDSGVFNFEGGCYAKCINLSKEKEPQIWEAIRFGTVIENVAIDPLTRAADYDSDKHTENTRAGYPIDFIPGVVQSGAGDHPETVIFLTADAFGVMPPIAKLNAEQAMYYFLSGYTSKLAGTERGIKEPQATFSTCFGAPFLPLRPMVYAAMLGDRIAKHNTRVFLINTGWSGGPYGVGNRMNLNYTRAMVTAALNGQLDDVAYRSDPVFDISLPVSCPGVPTEILEPRATWSNKEEYDRAAKGLARRFADNFKKFSGVPDKLTTAGPKIE
ncbi:phosphoenolpyruvate carboxykinase (ATP) [Metallumcola ferriviriculae]|uniref:Phosphoenolpyruvate carboxykinase (ATP) n=1 Tax=Metallumcola ferriviriculae TaxID=3039180 RepID=A0AAU0UUF3_9FIRM|nr:phosphoenolpyruvate carboxykinase (ATP) [Desulfitibacteraceae bacterium MK1]